MQQQRNSTSLSISKIIQFNKLPKMKVIIRFKRTWRNSYTNKVMQVIFQQMILKNYPKKALARKTIMKMRYLIKISRKHHIEKIQKRSSRSHQEWARRQRRPERLRTTNRAPWLTSAKRYSYSLPSRQIGTTQMIPNRETLKVEYWFRNKIMVSVLLVIV